MSFALLQMALFCFRPIHSGIKPAVLRGCWLLSYIKAALPSKSKKGAFHYAKPCQDSYYTLFSSYPMLLDYHEEQAKNSRWIRCKVADLQVEPLGESSPLIGNLSAFAAGTSQEAVKDTAENLGLAMRVNGELYPVRMTAYKACSTERRSEAPRFPNSAARYWPKCSTNA